MKSIFDVNKPEENSVQLLQKSELEVSKRQESDLVNKIAKNQQKFHDFDMYSSF